MKTMSDWAPILIIAAAILAGAASPPPAACAKDAPSADCVTTKKAPTKKHAARRSFGDLCAGADGL